MAKSKLNSIETLVCQALIYMEISHEELNAIVREKKIWEVKRECEKCQWKQENKRLNSVNSKK